MNAQILLTPEELAEFEADCREELEIESREDAKAEERLHDPFTTMDRYWGDEPEDEEFEELGDDE